MMIVRASILFALPWLLIWLEKRQVKIITSLSVIVWCYLLGFALNLSGLGFDKNLAQTMAYISFPLSLPLLLFEVNFSSWLRLAKPAVKGFFVAVFTSMIILIILPLVFFKHVPSIEKYAAMMSGMLTGGNVNFTALSVALEVNPNAYIGLYTSESLIGALYLLLVFKFSFIFLKRFFPPQPKQVIESLKKEQIETFNYKSAALAFLASSGVVGLSAGISYLIFRNIQPTVLIVLMTTTALILGAKTKLNTIKECYPLGEYLLYVFCLSLGLLLDLNQLSKIGIDLFLFVMVSYTGVVILHFAIRRLVKLDGHTALITNIAGIFGPPFILPIAKVLKNENVVMPGLTTSLVGQALGTYIGFAVLFLIRLLI